MVDWLGHWRFNPLVAGSNSTADGRSAAGQQAPELETTLRAAEPVSVKCLRDPLGDESKDLKRERARWD